MALLEDLAIAAVQSMPDFESCDQTRDVSDVVRILLEHLP